MPVVVARSYQMAFVLLVLVCTISQALSLSCHKSDTERDCTAPVDVLSVATPEECCLFNGGVTYLQNGSTQCMECIVYGFEETEISAIEGEKVAVFMENLRGTGRRIVVELSELPDSASALDYVLVGSRRVVVREVHRVRRIVRVLQDDLAEDSELLQLRLRALTLLHENEFLVDTLNISISDDKFLRVKFSRPRFTCIEGDSKAAVTITREPRLTEDFTVIISPLTFKQARNKGIDVSTTRTQASKADFMGEDIELILPANDTSQIAQYTVEVPIVDDDTNEASEEFMLSLTAARGSVHEHGVKFDNGGKAVCRIKDNDLVGFGFESRAYSITEGEGSLAVTLVRFPIGRPSEQDFELLLETTALSPFFVQSRDLKSPVPEKITFPANQQRVAIVLKIVNDRIPENSERLEVAISAGRSCRGAVNCSRNTEITIKDNDDLRVSFDSEETEVARSVGFAELCVSITAPKRGEVEREISLEALYFPTATTLSTAPAPASEHLVIHGGQRRTCFNTTIPEDDFIDHQFEEYTITLLEVDPDPLVLIAPSEITLTVVDDILTVVQFHNATYNVTEDGGFVEVCVEMKLPFRNASVLISTHSGNALDGIDFISLSQVPLSLHHLNALQCVPIEILNDRVAEGPQNFTVVMEALHVTELVTVSTSMATVIIYDDDDESELAVDSGACDGGNSDLSAQQEEGSRDMLRALQRALPQGLFGVEVTGEESLERLYEYFAEAFNTNTSEIGYNRFVEALSEISNAQINACSGRIEIKPTTADIPQLSADFKLAFFGGDQKLEDARSVVGKILCVQEQLIVEAIPCDSTCDCPLGSWDNVSCPCEFFSCLNQDDLQSILGFSHRDAFPCVAFIIDTTGSMRDEIHYVQGVVTNFARHQQERSSRLCFMLIPFNDNGAPENSVGPITFADTDLANNTLESFYESLRALRAFGGGDAPEFTFDAILQALQYTYTTASGGSVRALQPGSHLVVLTDAPSKRFELVDEIIREATANEICIHLFLQNYDYFSKFGYTESFADYDYYSDYSPMASGGDSGEGSGSTEDFQYAYDFSGYDRIHSETAGTLLKRIDSSAISQFIETYETDSCRNFNDRGFKPLVEFSPNISQCGIFLVSRLTTSIRAAISVFEDIFYFEQPVVTVFHPNGSETIAEFVTYNHALISVDSPQAGEWTVCVNRGAIDLLVHTHNNLNTIVLYPSEDGVTASTNPPICASQVVVLTSQAQLMGAVNLSMISTSGAIIRKEPMSICGEVLSATSNTSLPPGMLRYRLEGVDTMGIPFEYETQKLASFIEGEYNLTALGGPNLAVEIGSDFTLLFELTSHSNGASHFSFAMETAGFRELITPQRATVVGGETIRVQVRPFIASSAVQPGTSYTFTLVASTSCKTVTAATTVTMTAQQVATLPPFVCDCENGGTCSISIFRQRLYRMCLCPEGYTGTHCHIEE